jgi:quercetin dioxygenase-like cupin family protein
MRAGDFLSMPPNVPHSVKATQQFSMLLILSKPSPPSEKRTQATLSRCASLIFAL